MISPPRRRPPLPVVAGIAAVVVGLVFLAVGFNGSRDRDRRRTPGSDVASDVRSPVEGPHAPGRSPLAGFGERQIRVVGGGGGGRAFCVLVAETVAQRSRGLMTVTDPGLGGYDGMIFLFPEPTTGGFWMRNTPMPLSIAYLDGDGSIVSALDMEPCADRDDCPSYAAAGPFSVALEVPQGRLADLGLVGDSARVQLGGACSAAED